ncbi:MULTISPECIES: FAD-binding protein [unclassified Sphingobium]|uniref:FAD-binding protein n=1 Tax=unclassified Sphingobium TaxID=2611147 RepID=UPI000D160718|nr:MULTISPECIES: FAD-binding protein [unclassified Sphingobium]MBG6120045.1 3-oxosteroid 1-dehydrogenase [Sphingobium sp. JAI105]PSO12900.1 3-ketosteroid-delta-1-dehydrogenase [Sphingobium sp. AEW4]TWD05754.1 3-oxosteroid 1-dehydrogenase [Sphingobium sp. AEW010]TWD23307.1 3-oxosteroid 1-dehydrogenase [Sphingobium sp. AEW013]TWD25167.1 3-oxosteroid 1-dehydrogenase [Sphingobium sp. AEW001]
MSGFDRTVDFVIVGSGGGSMAAALAVKEVGQEPLVLEKTDMVGGSTAMSGGVLWIPANPLLAREGIKDSLDKGWEYMMNTVGDGGKGSTPERKRAYLETGPKLVTWLEGKGVKFRRFDGWSDYYDDRPGGLPQGRSVGMTLFDTRKLGEWESKLRKGPFPYPFKRKEMHRIGLAKRTWEGRLAMMALMFRMTRARFTGKHWASAGAAIQAQMLHAALKNDVEVHVDAPVTQLLVEDGKVVGVETRIDGRVQRIGARHGVLLNIGGFARNQAMRDRYHRTPTQIEWTNANPGDTGELLEQAIDLGADTDNLDKAVWIPGSLAPGAAAPFMHPQCIAKPFVMVVDSDGKRFMNEAGSYMEAGERMHDVIQKTGKPVWAILDARHRSHYAWGKQPPMMTPQKWFDEGYFFKANTLAELAAKIGVNPVGLEESAARMGRFARSGVDGEFNKGGRFYDRFAGDASVKPNPNLGPIDQAPFYAVRMFPGDVGTYGGLVTDIDGRVLKPDGSPIEGLFATGNCTASATGGVYPGAGASIAASFIFGWRAAQYATAH